MGAFALRRSVLAALLPHLIVIAFCGELYESWTIVESQFRNGCSSNQRTNHTNKQDQSQKYQARKAVGRNQQKQHQLGLHSHQHGCRDWFSIGLRVRARAKVVSLGITRIITLNPWIELNVLISVLVGQGWGKSSAESLIVKQWTLIRKSIKKLGQRIVWCRNQLPKQYYRVCMTYSLTPGHVLWCQSSPLQLWALLWEFAFTCDRLV